MAGQAVDAVSLASVTPRMRATQCMLVRKSHWRVPSSRVSQTIRMWWATHDSRPSSPASQESQPRQVSQAWPVSWCFQG